MMPIAFETKNGYIYCDTRTMCILLGTTSVNGNHHLYGIEKEGKKLKISYKKFEERIEILEERLEKIDNALCAMKKVWKGLKNGKI